MRCDNNVRIHFPEVPTTIRFVSPDGTYGIDKTIDIRIAPADSSIEIGLGTDPDPKHWLPTTILEMETGEIDRNAVYFSPPATGGGITHTVYRYTVQEGDNSADLDYKQTTSLYWRAPGGGFSYLNQKGGDGNPLDCILPVPGTAGSLSYQSDIVVDGIRPKVTGVSAAVPDGPYGQGRDIRVNVTFGEPVVVNGTVAPPSLTLDFDGTNREAAYASGNNSATLVFNYTVRAGDGAARLDYNATNALAGAITDIAGNPANLTLFAPGAPGSLAHSSRLEAETVSPTVESVSSPDGDATYGQGRPILVNVTFTERVVVDEAGGTPYIELETGATDRRAAYDSGNGTRSLLFRYMVAANDRSGDLDYTGASALSANGGTIRDAAGNDANLDLSGLPAGRTLAGSAALVVDGVAPRIANVTSPDDDDTYGTGTVINITVGFTEPVEFDDPETARPEMPLDTGSGESRRAACAPASGLSAELACAYTVVAGDDTPDLGYGTGSSLSLGGAAARDAAGNRMSDSAPLPDSPDTATLGGSKDIMLDTEVPRVLRVTSPNASRSYDAGETIRIEVVFDGNVTIDREPLPVDASVPTLRLETGEIDRAAAYADGSGTDTLAFSYTVAAGDFAPDLNYTGADALTLGDRELVDVYGNRNGSDPALPDPSSADSLGGQAAIAVRTVPTVVDVRANYTDASIRVGETVGIDVVFSEKVWVVPPSGNGVPHIELVTGRTDRGLAVYSSGSGTDTLAFSYPVHHADDAARLDYAGAAALKNNSAQVRGVGMLDANLSLPEQGPATPLAAAEIRLEPNEAPSFGRLENRTLGVGVDFNEAVTARDREMQRVTYSLVPPVPAGASIDGRTGHITWTPSEAQRIAQGGANATYVMTVRASDPHAAIGTARLAVTVIESPPPGYEGPAFAAIPPADGREGDEIRFDVRADGNGTIRYSLAADADPPPPPGAIMYPNGTFSWTPDYDENGTHAITAKAADRFGLHDTQEFTVTVADAEPPWNEPPEIEPVDPQSAAEGERLVVRVSATDPDVPITYSLPGDPSAGAAIHPATGVFTWEIGYDAAGTHNITVSAADRYNRTSHLSFTVVVADVEQPNLPPELAPIPPQRATAGTAIELQVNATDPNDGDELMFGLAGPRPEGATMAGNGLFTWTPGRDQIGSHTLNVTVRDAGGLSDWAPLAVAVADLPAADASAEAVFAGPRTVRIDYSAPLGPPAGHEGDVYGTVAIAGGGSAEPSSVSGVGTRTHIVRLGGDAAAAAGISQNGTIRLLAGLEGVAGGALHTLAAGDIPVAAGETARTLSPPGAAAPVAAIEGDGFVRALNATAAGDTARPALNVTDLAAAGAPPAPGGGITVTLPADGRVAIIASFAEVRFPPGATATGVPADGLLELYVAARAPTAQEVADGFGVDVADVLGVRRVVEIGDNATRIEFKLLPVRILLVGQANGSAFYVHGAGGAVVPITRECGADDAAAVHEQLGGSGACQLDSADGGNKIIYTYHLTRFGTALVDLGDTCSAALSEPEIAFGRIAAGGQSPAAAQEVRGTGTLPLALVSVSADGAWAVPGGAVVMPANATSARAAGGGAWTPLGSAAVDVPADDDGESVSVEFRLDVPQDALQAGDREARAVQAVTYTVTCAAPTG